MPTLETVSPPWLDGTLYPDRELPAAIETCDDRIDFLARLCAAWDFGILPDVQTVVEIRQPTWREAVDQCRFLTSPTYHLVRAWHNLPELPYLGQQLSYIRDDPNLAYV